jgi:DNA processing protein
LVELAQDVLEELLWPGGAVCPPDAQEAAPHAKDPEPENEALLIAMGFDPIGMDALQARTGLDTATLQVQLLDMELAGAVARLPGGLFQRMGRA